MQRPSVVFFSSQLLPASQTFIRALGENIQLFSTHYVGCRRVDGLDLPEERTFVINSGSLWGKATEAYFKLTGLSSCLYQHIQQLNPALIHAQFGLSGALILPLTLTLDIPLIVHFRGADATIPPADTRFASLNHWIYFLRQAQLKKQPSLFITVSQFIKDQLLNQGFPAERIVVHYHGVDTKYFAADVSVMRKPVVLFVGRLTEKKGCIYLIQAMARLQSVIPEVSLVVIGEGPLKSDMEQLAARTLSSYQFLGCQPPDVVKIWMNQASILAAPSVTAIQGDSEGLPNVVMEAQAMGLPVVSTVHAGIPEAVIHRKTGFLVAERDSHALAEACLQLFQDPHLWQQFSQAGQVHMRSHFDRATQTRALEEIYAAVLHDARHT